jgi:hypothetical protein
MRRGFSTLINSKAVDVHVVRRDYSRLVFALPIAQQYMISGPPPGGNGPKYIDRCTSGRNGSSVGPYFALRRMLRPRFTRTNLNLGLQQATFLGNASTSALLQRKVSVIQCEIVILVQTLRVEVWVTRNPNDGCMSYGSKREKESGDKSPHSKDR